jgi:hypothetical protein
MVKSVARVKARLFPPGSRCLSGCNASGRGNYAQVALVGLRSPAIFMGRTRYRRQIDLLSHHIS